VNALGRVTVGAPGVDMVGIGLDGGYVGAQQGSPLAAAIVAATVADLRVTFPELTPAQLRERLASTADRPGVAVPDAALGWGVVNPVTALTAPIGVPGTLAAESGTATTQTGAAATGAGALPVAGSSVPAPAVQVTLPPEPADNRWALVVAGALLILAAAAAALVLGVRRARARKWRPAGLPAPDPPPPSGAERGPAPEPVESVADQPSTDVVPTESSAATAEIPVSGTGSPN
jgi:membrane-anchored mycosin MYCP